MTAPRKAHVKQARLFVGSSAEGLDVAYAVQENLQYDADVTVWPQGIFAPSGGSLGSLLTVLDESDFGIFVFTPDDSVRLRKKAYAAVRDNVIFELGLFAGRLGVERAFFVVPDGVHDLRIPTDLAGITPGRYKAKRDDGNLQAALGPFCNQVRRAIKKYGPVPSLPSRPPRPPVVRLRHVDIHSARYGAGDHWRDVKSALVSELKQHGVAYAGNQLGGDPCPGKAKELQLDFTYRGERQQVVLPEGRTLKFPE
jgi:hypothetical protein